MSVVRVRGFTLLEMTVTLLLVALISTIILSGLRFAARATTQVSNVDAADWEVFVAQRFLRTALAAAHPLDPARAAGNAFGLEGTASRVTFSASAGRSPSPGELLRYQIELATDTRDPRRMNLVVSSQVDGTGRSYGISHREVLLTNVRNIVWSFVDACQRSTVQSHWQKRRELPALINLQVVFPVGDVRQWPALSVAPRVTDDAISWVDRRPRGCTVRNREPR